MGKTSATHCNILAWRITWTEEPDGLQSRGWQRVKYDRVIVTTAITLHQIFQTSPKGKVWLFKKKNKRHQFYYRKFRSICLFPLRETRKQMFLRTVLPSANVQVSSLSTLVPFDILSCSEVCILLCEFRTYLTSTLVYTPLSEFIWTRENHQTYIQDDDCMRGFPGHAGGKESACQFRRHKFDPCVRKIFWRRKWQPTPGLWHGNVKRVGQDSAQSAIGPRHFPRITISFSI